MDEETLKVINEKIRKYLNEGTQIGLDNAIDLINTINNPLNNE